MNKLGYSEKQIGHMTHVKWSSLYSQYKKVYNFEHDSIPTQMGYVNNTYALEEEENKESYEGVEIIAF